MSDTQSMAIFLRALHLRMETKFTEEMFDAAKTTSHPSLAIVLGCLALQHKITAETLQEMMVESEKQEANGFNVEGEVTVVFENVEAPTEMILGGTRWRRVIEEEDLTCS